MGDEFATHGARAIVIAEPLSSHHHRSPISLFSLSLSLSLSLGGLLFWLLLVSWDLWIGVNVGFGSALIWVLGWRCGCEIWDGWRLMKVATDDLDRWRLLLVFVWWNDESVAMFVCLNRWLFVCLNRWWFGIWVVVVLGDWYLLGFFFFFGCWWFLPCWGVYDGGVVVVVATLLGMCGGEVVVVLMVAGRCCCGSGCWWLLLRQQWCAVVVDVVDGNEREEIIYYFNV